MGMPDLLKSIDKVDDNTVKFTLKKPNAPFIANLAMDFAAIHSAEYVDAMLKAGTPERSTRIRSAPGPSSSSSYEKDAVIRYKAFPAYLRRQAEDRQPRLRHHPRRRPCAWPSSRRANAIIAPYPSPADLPKLMADKKLKVEHQEGLNVGYLAFNTEKPPFDKKEVRQALNMAIDKDAIIKAVYQGAGQPAKNPIPPTIWSYDKNVTAWPYDPAKAQAMLKAAGVTNLSDRSLVHAGAASLQSGRQEDRRDDAGGSRQGRHQRQARDLRMGRVPQASPGGRGTRWASSAGPATMAIRTISWACC